MSSLTKDAEFLNQVDVNNTVDLHKSNLLRIQIDELVKECKKHYNDDEILSNIIQILQGTPKHVKFDKKSPFPRFSDQEFDHVEILDFEIRQLNDHLASTKPSGCANLPHVKRLLFQVSKDTFGPKDYLRHRYFDKRNMILWHIKKHLQASSIDVSWCLYRADPRTPILVIPYKHNCHIHIHCAPDDFIMPLLRLAPNRSNLSNAVARSCYYNNLLVEEMYDETLEDIDQHDYPHLEDTIIALQVWCQQRGLCSHDGLDREQIALLLLYLLRSKRTNPRMGPSQVLSAFFKFVAETNWLGEKIDEPRISDSNKIRKQVSEGYRPVSKTKKDILVMPGDDPSELEAIYEKQTKESPLTTDDPATLRELYQREDFHGPVFLNSSMTRNYFGRLSPSFVRLLQREARKSLGAIRASPSPFQYLFMSQARFWERYDVYFRVSLEDVKAESISTDLISDLGRREAITRSMIEMLLKAFGDRVHHVAVLSTGNGELKGDGRSDEVPIFADKRKPNILSSPTNDSYLIFGLTINPDTCFRLVDRGPPAESADEKRSFLDLWGSKAELRRFKDGAIIHAVVWDDVMADMTDDYVIYQNGDKVQGGIIERITRHILARHFFRPNLELPSFMHRDLMSAIDGATLRSPTPESALFQPLTAHKRAMKAFDNLAECLRKNSIAHVLIAGTSERRSTLGLPLPIDSVEPIAPSLRYAELFPPLPHPSLGCDLTPGSQKISGAIASLPIDVQIRFGSSSKWPTDIKAMRAAKAAMLIQLAEGIEELKTSKKAEGKGFNGPLQVSPEFALVGFQGYVFRIFVRADPEINLLQKLTNPSDEARKLLRSLTQRHLVASSHHSMVHAVYTSHPSSSMVVRLAQRWLASHLLSNHIRFEALELIIAHIYTSKTSSLDPPASVMSGFLRFLQFVSTFDWIREPLIVDPQNQLSSSEVDEINTHFVNLRGKTMKGGAPMYIASPNDRLFSDTAVNFSPGATWVPSFTQKDPEIVVLSRFVILARASYTALKTTMMKGDANPWISVFQESGSSFRSYSALLRVDPHLMIDQDSSCTSHILPLRKSESGDFETMFTRSVRNRYNGPKELRHKVYRNLDSGGDVDLIMQWHPVTEVIGALRKRLDSSAVFFYNEFCPEVIAVVWRPLLQPRPFSALVSEYVRPTKNMWKSNDTITLNVKDMLREITQIVEGIVVDQKVLDEGIDVEDSEPPKAKKRKVDQSSSSSDESDNDHESESDSE